MPEIETQATKTRAEAAEYLRQLAGQLEADGDVTLDLGGRSVTVTPTDPLVLKLEGEWGALDTAGTESIELELVWGPAADTDEDGASHP